MKLSIIKLLLVLCCGCQEKNTNFNIYLYHKKEENTVWDSVHTNITKTLLTDLELHNRMRGILALLNPIRIINFIVKSLTLDIARLIQNLNTVLVYRPGCMKIKFIVSIFFLNLIVNKFNTKSITQIFH